MQLTLLSINNQQIQTENLSSLSSLPHEIKQQQQQLHNTKKPHFHISHEIVFFLYKQTKTEIHYLQHLREIEISDSSPTPRAPKIT
jgi:hypothetical protein